jgi:hypothetical protein
MHLSVESADRVHQPHRSSKSTEDVDKVPTKKTAAAGRRDVDSEKEKRPRSKTAESSAQ